MPSCPVLSSFNLIFRTVPHWDEQSHIIIIKDFRGITQLALPVKKQILCFILKEINMSSLYAMILLRKNAPLKYGNTGEPRHGCV